MAEGFAKSPDEVTFAPHIRRLDDTCLEVKMMACPIKDATVDAGCTDKDLHFALLRLGAGRGNDRSGRFRLQDRVVGPG